MLNTLACMLGIWVSSFRFFWQFMYDNWTYELRNYVPLNWIKEQSFIRSRTRIGQQTLSFLTHLLYSFYNSKFIANFIRGLNDLVWTYNLNSFNHLTTQFWNGYMMQVYNFATRNLQPHNTSHCNWFLSLSLFFARL